MEKILVLDLHTPKDLTEGPKVYRAFEQFTEVQVAKLFLSDFNYGILRDFRGIVLTGSDNPDLLTSSEAKRLEPYLLDAPNFGTHVLGICAGCELLADIFGYPVHTRKSPEVGWPWVSLTEKGKAHPLFTDVPERFRLFVYHVRVVECDDKERILAYSRFGPQAILFEHRVYGVQPHIEETPESGSEFLKMAEGGRYAHIIPSAPASTEHYGYLIAQNFVNMVRA